MWTHLERQKRRHRCTPTIGETQIETDRKDYSAEDSLTKGEAEKD